MAQRRSKRRKSRKRRRGASAPRPPAPDPRPPSRSEARNQAAREALEPLAEGERPTAVTVAAIVAVVLALANLGAYAAGLEISDQRPNLIFVASYSALMLVAAWGMWRVRYWAVLGMQAILAIAIIIFSLLLVQAQNVLAVVVPIAIVLAAGTLFWFLVKAMARIQMPERR